jgi:hypothetical protein
VLGLLSLALFAWEYENDRVIESMGMAWDTRPPMWPYRVVPLFSYALNAPAYTVCWPAIRLINTRADWVQYAIWLPVITAMWWWVGTRIDFGLLGRRSYLHPRFATALLLAGALILLILSVNNGVGEYRSFQLYWPSHPPVYAVLLLRAMGPMLWRLLFAGAFIRSAFYLWVHPLKV